MAPKNSTEGKKHSTVKNYLVPHEGNSYHPKLFRTAAVVTLVLAIALFEGAYFVDTKLVQNHTNFLASVLPAALLDLTNADRAASGVAPLKEDPELAKAAQLKANDMATNGYFAHVSPTGKTPWYWLDQIGYDYSYAGENLAINFDDSTAVEEAWMKSPTHHANLVKPQYTRVGYAVANGIYEGKETTFVVQEFATNPADETVTKEVKPKGVVATAVEKVIDTVKPASQAQQEAEQAPIATTETKGDSSAAQVAFAGGTASATPIVLGTETGSTRSDSTFANFFRKIAAAPTYTSTYVLGILAVLLSILLIFALFAHAKVRYVEVLGAGVFVIVIALGVLVYNAMHSPDPVVPDGASAAVQVSATP